MDRFPGQLAAGRFQQRIGAILPDHEDERRQHQRLRRLGASLAREERRSILGVPVARREPEHQRVGGAPERRLVLSFDDRLSGVERSLADQLHRDVGMLFLERQGRRFQPLFLLGAVEDLDLDARALAAGAAGAFAALVEIEDGADGDGEHQHDDDFPVHAATLAARVCSVSSNAAISWFIRSTSCPTSPPSASAAWASSVRMRTTRPGNAS